MLVHYIKIAFRNLAKQKVLALINVLGLTIGIAFFSLFLLYALNEFNFDRFHANKDNIYKVYRWSEPMNNEEARGDVYLPMPLGPTLKNDFPDVKKYVRTRGGWSKNYVRVDGKVSMIPVGYADNTFFEVFTFPLKYGNPATVLKDMHSAVITEKVAEQLFHGTDPVGKTIELKLEDNFERFTVTGVAKNIPSNSSLSFEILCSFEHFENTQHGKKSSTNWNWSGYETYIELKPGSKLPRSEKTLQSFYDKYYPGQEEELRTAGYWKGKGSPITYGLQPLEDMHTNTTINSDSNDPKNVWILIMVSIGILAIAGINFTTLAIGRSAGRAKEIGVRKVIGGTKNELVFQFLTEALLLSIFSTILGLVLAQLLLPYFNTITGLELIFSLQQFPELSWLLLITTVLVGLLSGSYPALVMSSFRPIDILRKKLRLNGSNYFTKSLVTMQFVLSVALIIATFVIIKQLQYMKTKDIGFNKENIIVVDADDNRSGKIYPLFRQALINHPSVKGVTGSDMSIGEGMGWSISGFDYKGENKQVSEYYVDPYYLNVMGISLLKGRNFELNNTLDTSTSVIINEKMMADFGWTLDNVIGQKLEGYYENKRAEPIVIGVIKNFNFRPLKEEVKPQMFQCFNGKQPYKFLVKTESGTYSETLEAIEKTWKELMPDLPLNYTFMDEDIEKFYKSEAKLATVIGIAGGVSIFLACLGLFGLTSLVLLNRTKEIGIRKILGATHINITQLISADFIKLILVSIVIAAPVTWYYMNEWLKNFAYRIEISWWIFVGGGIVSVLIALITISIQTVKAANANPVNSLRSE